MSVSDIIDALGGPSVVSAGLSLPATTVGNWRLRQSIPAKHQQAVLTFAKGKVTATQMVAAHAEHAVARGLVDQHTASAA